MESDMQVNDVVKVVAPGHQYENQAGVVNKVEDGIHTVKLDTVEAPQLFTADELLFLAR